MTRPSAGKTIDINENEFIITTSSLHIERKDGKHMPPFRRSPSDGGQTIVVGTLSLIYLRGKSGPEELGLVRMDDFETLRRAIGAYRLVRQLRQMTEQEDSDAVWNILNSAGVSRPHGGLKPPTQVKTQLMLYRRNGITALRVVEIPAYDLYNANLVNTFSVKNIRS